jgi:hypothetical protein
MLGNQDAPLEIQGLAEILLPEQHSVRIGDWGKDVIQNHLI